VVSPVEAKTEKSVTNPPVVPVDKAQSAIEKGVAGLK
jgi:hypothetical protein